MSIEKEDQARKRFLLVCQGLFCLGRGSHGLLAELRNLKQQGVLPSELEIKPYYCFNGCSHGPNMVSYPDRVWFERVSPDNLTQVVTYLGEGIPATDPLLNQCRVIEVVRHRAYSDIKEELGF
ncbi:MAG: hypothetical protein JWP00_2542 [Chloroflexi bacterium]|jgi:(2Fe-2S) ferredoxin|nr:hypothetical protein [Chloroflexota bacterium]